MCKTLHFNNVEFLIRDQTTIWWKQGLWWKGNLQGDKSNQATLIYSVVSWDFYWWIQTKRIVPHELSNSRQGMWNDNPSTALVLMPIVVIEFAWRVFCALNAYIVDMEVDVLLGRRFRRPKWVTIIMVFHFGVQVLCIFMKQHCRFHFIHFRIVKRIWCSIKKKSFETFPGY